MMTRPAILICFALVAAGAVVHGATTHRWAAFAPPPSRADQFHAYVLQLGDYQCEDIPNEIPLKEKSTGTTKRYTSPSRNLVVVTSLISGPPGAVSTHTPDVCYPSSGYRTVRQPVRWAWSSDGRWDAPDRPRFAYLRAAELYKLYVVTPVVDGDDGRPAEDPPAVKQFVAAAFAQYAGLFAGR